MPPDTTQQTASGLSDPEAALRLRRDGPNELPQDSRRTVLRIMLEVAREPMFQLLCAAGVIYLILGDVGEALMLLGFVAITITITIVQEKRTENVLEALRDLTSPRALVIRGGERKRIAGREVVRGDLLVLAEGDRVPADARLLTASELQADESLLTGESVPVRKLASAGAGNGGDGVAQPPSRPGGDDLPFVYSGSLVVRGHGLAEVTATGGTSEIGRIGRALGAVEAGRTPLHTQTRRLVKVLSVVGLALSAAVVALYGLLRGDWLGGVLGGITLAMAMLPEEFMLILTVFLAMGAWRMSRQRVLSRRPATIETLGAATVLCTDKTGTLTQNRMTIAELDTNGASWTPVAGDLPEAFHLLVEFGILASETDPFDPMEKAFHELGREHLAGTEHLHERWVLAHEYGLAPDLLAMSHVWRAVDRPEHVIAAKGAPEAIANLCHLPPAALATVRAAAERLAGRGMRVLGVARATFEGDDWPGQQHDFDFEFLGLVALADPLRPAVNNAVRECRAAGIKVAMITGDYPATALAIAAQAGIDVTGGAISGDDLQAMTDEELRRRVRGATVFARIMPEQKLRIVEAFKANGEVVAMTGDGVNDAPSLKAAHIGIAMGKRGTDVAREAAALVLLDDDFGSIVHAVRLGRRIYDNLKKAMAFVFAVHVPIAGLSLIPLLFGWPIVFMPVHIAFLELVIDPVCSIVFEAEPEEAGVMQRPPRDPAAPLFSGGLMLWSVFQGGCVLLAVGAFFVGLLRHGVPEAEARATTFVALVIANFGLIIVNRSFSASVVSALARPNRAFWAMAAATAALLAAALFIPPLRDLFHFGPVHLPAMAAAFGVGAAVLLGLELLKHLGLGSAMGSGR
ncbi:MAG: cation-translocating P-type ATPase [Betaproteobacteria bacterium]|nr:cation-translocating P-type ATPase [Betaproteobacteria bacterium]